MWKRWVLLLTVLIAIASAGPAHSGLVQADDPVFGPGSITRDTGTGMEWLDVTITRGRSFVDVQSSLATEFVGFRFATRAEVRMLFDAAGLPPDGVYHTAPFFDLGPFLALVGKTFMINTYSRGVLGWTGDMPSPNSVFYASASENFQVEPPQLPYQWINSTAGQISNGAASPDLGSWLVRGGTSVPNRNKTWGSVKHRFH